MPELTLTVPAEYGYVILFNGVGTFFTLMYLGGQVMKARKQYNVQYPNMYAVPGTEKANEFNNVQRGHQNALETFPSYLAMSLIGGLKHPIPVAAGGLCWIVGRVLYMEGYKAGPETRYKKGGGVMWLGVLASMASCVHLAASLLSA